MKAEVIAIGSELVSGQSLDTNSQWLSQSLGAIGIPVHYHTALGDDLRENVEVLRIAINRADLVVTSGGLGPTQDDLTRQAMAEVSGVPLVEDLDSLEAIRSLFARRKREMPDRNRVQALLPEGAEALSNAVGTAPGIAMLLGRSRIVCLPGVPNELKLMFDEQVVPWLARSGVATRSIVQRKINLFGKGESEIEAEALDLTARNRSPEVGITASEATISFRIAAEADTREEANQMIEPTARLIYQRFEELIVGEGAEDVVHAVVRELNRTGRTIATAESCTGGLVAHLLTSIPGVSRSFPGGLVTYGSEAKINLLDLPASMIKTHGAVSAEVAGEMARRVRERFRADLGLSVTGFAGPDTDTPPHAVGLVYLGLATGGEIRTRKLELGPEQPREVIQKRAAKQALNWARLTLRKLENRPNP
ncbi:competence/damage-inducible protein A [Tundrisphaera lichenicola]|uniref:competence/damage-inducible protein A n=1 Tax=Tundrisphaera lichenicola TaxID=2029860 RepID=UPI003EBEEAB8